MNKLIKEALMNIGEIVKNEGFPYEITEPNASRMTLNIDEQMIKDRGLSAGNSVVDLYYEETTKTVFVGMFRIPKKIRGKKLSSEMITHIKNLAHTYSFTIIVDSCEGCDRFWRKQEFKLVSYMKYFDIMLYTLDKENGVDKWHDFKKTSVYKEHFSYLT